MVCLSYEVIFYVQVVLFWAYHILLTRATSKFDLRARAYNHQGSWFFQVVEHVI